MTWRDYLRARFNSAAKVALKNHKYANSNYIGFRI